jgi:undecaprenyl-diphosphatase
MLPALTYLRRWFTEREPLVLVLLLVAVCGAWGFIELADDVGEDEPHALDVRLLEALRDPQDPGRPLGPRWMAEVGRDVTALGSLVVLGAFTAAVAGYLWLDGKHRLMVVLVVATGCGALLSHALKLWFQRPRPDVVPHLTQVHSTSFPSGHSMMAAAVYLTLGALLAAAVPRRRLRIYVLGLAIGLALAVGVSRVYLGVHYPSDVLAGWAAGLTWAIACWLTARWLQRTHHVEEAL